MTRVDVDELREKVKVMYRAVATQPSGTFHFTPEILQRIATDISDDDTNEGEAEDLDDSVRAIHGEHDYDSSLVVSFLGLPHLGESTGHSP